MPSGGRRSGTPWGRGGTLAELGLLFLRLGAVSFGGRWLTRGDGCPPGGVPRGQFLDMVAATNLIPGPDAAEMAIWIGYLRARWSGLLVAGLAFILPGALLSSLLPWVYGRYGGLPELQRVLRYGVHPAVLVVFLAAAVRLGRSALPRWGWGLRAGGGFALALLGVDPLWIPIGAGPAAVARRAFPRSWARFLAAGPLVGGGSPRPPGGHRGPVLCQGGALLFGSGMMLFAFIEREVVGQGWLTARPLAHAIAADQVTPGPVLSSATFIGWLLGGPGGRPWPRAPGSSRHSSSSPFSARFSPAARCGRASGSS